jgi:DNA-binding transcriptional MocR family regulator
MLDDAPTMRAVAAARVEYARRRAAVSEVLDHVGVRYTGTDGINLWMQVADERSALITLAARGIGAAPGEPFMVRPDTPSLRVTVGLIHDDLEGVAKVLADAAGTVPTRAGQR